MPIEHFLSFLSLPPVQWVGTGPGREDVLERH